MINFLSFPNREYFDSNIFNKLQSLLDMAQFYGEKYQVKYGAAKTKVTITGPAVDQDYYKDRKPWTMEGETVQVVDTNEHLGQIIGDRQEERNIDLRIKKARNSLFGLLGPAFAYKCLISPAVKLHLYRTYVCPILRSGLSTFALRKTHLGPMEVFQRKCLKSFLQLNERGTTPAIHFLTGELPIEAKIHRDIYSLFYSLWTNPNTKVFQVVKYLLQISPNNSRTWSTHLRHISKMYGIEDPLKCLESVPPPKKVYKKNVITKITAFHERELRQLTVDNSAMIYLNVSLIGLNGRLHPAITGVTTSHQVKKMRPHIKMLCGNYLTYEIKSSQSGGSPDWLLVWMNQMNQQNQQNQLNH